MSNDKTESISDKLRRWEAESRKERKSPMYFAIKDLGLANPYSNTAYRIMFRYVTDKIDKEVSEAKEAHLGDEFARFAEVIGKPMLEDESIEGWLNRYYLPRPLFEDGEPVQLGDTVVDKLRGEMLVTRMSWVGNGVYFNGSHDRSGKKLRTSRIAYARGERVRRPEPRVLDADGVPIEVGDTVWKVGCKHAYGVYEIDESKFYDVLVVRKDCGLMNRFYHDKLTHREPDTQQRIDEDAIKAMEAYWGCMSSHCMDCPAKVDEKRPFERYETGKGLTVTRCLSAQRLDLLRRQRELDGRDA